MMETNATTTNGTITKPKYSYNKDRIARASKAKQFAKNWYSALITAAEASVSQKAGHLMLTCTFNVLKEHGDSSSIVMRPKIKKWITLPLDNTEKKDHVAPESSAGMVRGFLRAIGIEVMSPPRRNKSRQWEFNGEIVDEEGVHELELQAAEALAQKCGELYDDPTQLVGYNCYILVKPDKEYNAIDAFRAELPPGVTLPDPTEYFVTGESADEGEDAAS